MVSARLPKARCAVFFVSPGSPLQRVHPVSVDRAREHADPHPYMDKPPVSRVEWDSHPSVRRNQAAERHRPGYLPYETRSFSGEGLKLPTEVFPYQQTWQDTVVDARQ
jgi:hypothetical protein